jgi:hypothetical protein
VRQSPRVEPWEPGILHCCKSLYSNTELVVRQFLTSKEVNTEAEGATALEAVTRQLVKTQQTDLFNPYTLIRRVTTLYSSLLHTHTHTHTHTLVFTVKSSLRLLGSGFQREAFPFLCVPELSLTSATSLSQQQLTMTKP